MKHFTFMALILLLVSCKKDWLDISPNKALIVPRTIADYRSLLDDTFILNNGQVGGMGELGASDFQVSYATFLTGSALVRNCYSWAATEDFFEGARDADWRAGYQRILSANLVLEGLNSIPRTTVNQADWDNLKGTALFYRAYDFFNLVQQYGKAYSSSSVNDPGIPLRLSADINLKPGRGTVQQVFDQILQDLKLANELLVVKPEYKTRPSKTAAYALLARISLAMRDYPNALINASQCLEQQNTLLNFADLNADQSFPFTPFSEEVIYQCKLSSYSFFSASRMNVVPALLNGYETGDLRRKFYFYLSGTNTVFKGSYTGATQFFGGLAVDEVLLIRAECYARAGNVAAALIDLNRLLKNRWVKSPAYVDFSTNDQQVLLNKILLERRKELCFRGIRWPDLKRLNLEPDHQVILSKEMNGVTITLPPNDARYQVPLDQNEISVGGLTQNPRN